MTPSTSTNFCLICGDAARHAECRKCREQSRRLRRHRKAASDDRDDTINFNHTCPDKEPSLHDRLYRGFLALTNE